MTKKFFVVALYREADFIIKKETYNMTFLKMN